MRPGNCLCRFNNVPLDGNSVAQTANSRHHPAPNAGPHLPPLPIFAVINPGMGEEDDPGLSTSETYGSH